jgi:phosphatidylserine/phosphatidylglycerophosphate/cardiolipin synthase-like enzyme
MDFSDVSQSDLRALADALGNRIRPPYSTIAIQRFVTGSQSDSIAAKLESLDSAGFSADQVALLLKSVLAERNSQPKFEDIVDLVTTGPEAPGMTNRDTAVVVRNLFSKAQSSVLVVGYAVYQGQKVFAELAERMSQNADLKVQMHLDIRRDKDTSLESVIVKRFINRFKSWQWPTECRMPDIYYDPRSVDTNPSKRASLHAKCIVVDAKEVFISSANFTERAQHRNIEVGLRISSEQLAGQLISHFKQLTEHRLLVPAT